MFDSETVKKDMQGVLNRFELELKKVRTGRAHPDMLTGISAEVYGQWMPLNQVANIVVADATMITVTPFDATNIAKISEAIRSDQSMNLNPADDGRLIRVPIPPLTEERRVEIVKNTSGKVEEAKVQIRNVREDARKNIKILDLPEDARKRAEKEVDEMTREFSLKIDEMFKAKEAEIMKI